MKVTKTHVHDGWKLVPLLKEAMQNANVSIRKVIADVAYDIRKNFDNG